MQNMVYMDIVETTVVVLLTLDVIQYVSKPGDTLLALSGWRKVTPVLSVFLIVWPPNKPLPYIFWLFATLVLTGLHNVHEE